MKKFILYLRKSVHENCLTFPCRFNAGFSSIFKVKLFTKNLVSFGTLLLLVITQTTTYGQLVGSSAVKGNFGIDGDIYANLLQFSNIAVPPVPIGTPAAGTDDWFVNSGGGLGVIDESMPYPIINNTAFSRRQSVTTPTSPYPYPVVNGYLWVDAVYGRDTYVKGGGAETSYFAGSGDKNSDNPSTWSIGLSGSVPQKDDIIDVFAHLRGEGLKDPSSSDPRVYTTLWAYAAASIAVTNGNKHVDFEFFRTEVTLANLNTPGSTGPNGGRTAFTFNADGSVNVPGTVVISVDYTNGGTVPQVRIRVWMDETVFNNYNNTALLRPFTIDKNTAFEKGTDSGTFGYAAILENVGATDIWGRVNDTASTLGPPWGTFEGAGPDAVTSFQSLQFIEIGVNLTAFGLDKRGEQSPCSNILGSLIVKTRASGGGPNEGAFGSELKDFAGPFLFGNTGNPPVPSVDDKIACENAATGSATVDLTVGANSNGGVLTYYEDALYEKLIETPTTFSAPIGVTTIHVRSEKLSNPGCYGTTTFTVSVTDNPDITVQNLTACETGETGAASVDLAGAILTNPDAGVITYYTSLADAQNEVNGVASPTSVTVASSPRIFWILAEAGTTNCYSTASFTVSVTDNPDITVQNLTACETGDTGAASVALAGAILTNPDSGVITYYNSLADAQNEVNGVSSPTSVTVASSPREFWIRAEAGTTNCYSTASFTVSVTDNPDITVQNLTACETGDTGAATVALTGAILTNPDSGVITYYNSLADAQNEVNGVASPTSVTVASSPRTFWIRAEAGTTNCYSTASFTVSVTDNPDITVQNLTACEIGTTGAASMDLTTAILTNPDGGVISYYNSLADAQNEVNSVSSPTSVTVASSPRTFWIRAEAGTTNCYSTASFTATITDEPDITVQNLTACETGSTGAASVALTDAILTNPDGGVISFHNSLADAQNDVNAVASPTSVTVASSPRTFWVRAEAGTCYSTASFTVSVTDNPDITVKNLTTCETGDTGAASIDLTAALLTNPDGGVISYYNSLADAQNEVNGVSSPISVTVASSPRTFWIRAEAGTTNCYSTVSFTATVTDNPEIKCPDNVSAAPVKCGVSATDAQDDANAKFATWFAQFATLNPGFTPVVSYVYTPATAAPATGTAPVIPVIGSPALANPTAVTVTWTITDANSCENSCSATYSQNYGCAVSCNIKQVTNAKCYDDTNGSITVAASGGTLPYVIYLYNKSDLTTPIANSGPLNTEPAEFTFSGLGAGIYVTESTDAVVTRGDGAPCEATITEPTVVEATDASTKVTCIDGKDGSVTLTFSGGTPPYMVNFNDGGFETQTSPKTYSGLTVGTYNWVVKDANECSVRGSEEVGYVPCEKALCTYTQGYYGNPGGMSCADGQQYTTTELIAKALDSYGGTMTIGSSGRSIYITAPDDIDDVIRVLPGGGGSSALLAGDIRISESGFSSYLRKGNINNTLLAQTITLGLNLGIDSALGGFVLQAGMDGNGNPIELATAAPEGGCGFDIPMSRGCSIPEGYGIAVNEYEYFTFPVFVDGMTVQELFDMANAALGGGTLPDGVTLSGIASAVDMVNNAFDECRIPMGYDQTRLVCITTSPQEFVAFEVPIVNNQLTIKYKFSYVSDVTIDVFDAATGAKLFSKFDANSYLDKEVKIDYNFNTGIQKVYIVRLTTRLGHDEQKVLSSPY